MLGIPGKEFYLSFETSTMSHHTGTVTSSNWSSHIRLLLSKDVWKLIYSMSPIDRQTEQGLNVSPNIL